MKKRLKKHMTTMPRHIQEEKLNEFLKMLDKDPSYEDDALLNELDNDLLEIVRDKLKEILDKILEDIEYLQMPRQVQEEKVKEYLAKLWEDSADMDERLLDVLDEDLLELITEEQSIIIEDLQHEIYELEIEKRKHLAYNPY